MNWRDEFGSANTAHPALRLAFPIAACASLLQSCRRPLIQGFLLWVVMGSGTLGAIVLGWIG